MNTTTSVGYAAIRRLCRSHEWIDLSSYSESSPLESQRKAEHMDNILPDWSMRHPILEVKPIKIMTISESEMDAMIKDHAFALH